MKRKQAEFPLFSEFVRGYLHQDAIPEHGTAVGAAKAYLEDLSDKDRMALAKEIRGMREAFKKMKPAELTRRLHQMGTAWTFESDHEFEQVLSTLLGSD
jgi:hypothetical protein